jgi:peptidoglycan/xylan/chitin deacetylase (PgdA/CDA1 family)
MVLARCGVSFDSSLNVNYKYTLYAIAKAIEDEPAVRISAVRDGHGVASHAYRWIEYAEMPAEQEKAYIRKEIIGKEERLHHALKAT